MSGKVVEISGDGWDSIGEANMVEASWEMQMVELARNMDSATQLVDRKNDFSIFRPTLHVVRWMCMFLLLIAVKTDLFLVWFPQNEPWVSLWGFILFYSFQCLRLSLWRLSPNLPRGNLWMTSRVTPRWTSFEHHPPFHFRRQAHFRKYRILTECQWPAE